MSKNRRRSAKPPNSSPRDVGTASTGDDTKTKGHAPAGGPSQSVVSPATANFGEKPSLSAIQWILSVAIAFHFVALFIALGSNLYKSRLQGELMNWLAPYQVMTSQTYGGQPLELTHAEPFDFPLLVQIQYQDSDRWEAVDLNEFDIQNQHYSRWPTLARAFQIIASENAESEMLGEIAFRFVKHLESSDALNESSTYAIQTIRFQRPVVPSYDEYSASTPELQKLVGLEPVTVYEAQVVRGESGVVGVIPAQEDYRSSKPLTQEGVNGRRHPAELESSGADA